MPSPACMPRRASSARWCSAAAPARAAMSRSRCSRPWRTSRSSRSPPSSRSDQVPTSADRPRLAQAYILRTADERLIAIHLSSLEKFWKGLVAALEAPELASDPRFNPRERRIAEYETLRLELDARFSQKPLAHWMQRSAGAGRAVRARQPHRRCGEGSAGGAPGTHRAGRGPAYRDRSRAAGPAVRRRACPLGERGAAAEPARRGDPRRTRARRGLAGCQRGRRCSGAPKSRQVGA